MIMAFMLIAALAGHLPQSELGKAGSICRPEEAGPALIVSIDGLKDRRGLLKLEVYPATDDDFLADDTALVAADKTFRRIEVPVPSSGPVSLCVRTPAYGTLAIVVLHDRDENHKLTISSDGIGFSRNPKLGWSKPKAASVGIPAPAAPIRLHIVMNYRRGLFSFAPLR